MKKRSRNKAVETAGYILTTEKTFFGYTTSEIFGVLLMIIPFYLGMTFSHTVYWFEAILGKRAVREEISIKPETISIMLSIALYFGLALRFNIFKTNNLLNGILSSIRMFLNCSVMAMIIRIVYPVAEKTREPLPFFQAISSHWEIMILVLAVVLTWAGIRTVAGYSWLICIFVSIVVRRRILLRKSGLFLKKSMNILSNIYILL